MTKVYLVIAHKVDEQGRLNRNSKKRIHEVFTSRRLANNAVDYLNEEWRQGFYKENFNFKNVWWYSLQMMIISHENYKKIPY